MTERKLHIVGLGEILWDLFPQGKQLGGAPANFAYCAGLLGDIGIAASRVGRDSLGEEALQSLRGLGLETSFIQSDPLHPTGTVNVRLGPGGEPEFEITYPVAWDFLDWEPSWQNLGESADAVCFGSLAQRSPRSRRTIRAFLAALRPQTVRVFDVNLRQSFYSSEILADSLRLTDVLKLNHEELPRVLELLGLTAARDSRIARSENQTSRARRLLHDYRLQLVCVTRGARGSLLITRNAVQEHPGFPVPVVDTVGAGDAFTAALVHHYLRGSSLAAMNEAANRMGAWVASQTGATPPADPAALGRIRLAC
jgi:fructokinase